MPPRTKAIVPVDIAGIPCDYDRIFSIVEKKRALFSSENRYHQKIGRIVVLADAAHAFGAEYHGKKCGTIAPPARYREGAESFLRRPSQNSGIRLSEPLNIQFMLLSLHGQTKDAFSKMELASWEYDIVSPAYKCNMTDITAENQETDTRSSSPTVYNGHW